MMSISTTKGPHLILHFPTPAMKGLSQSEEKEEEAFLTLLSFNKIFTFPPLVGTQQRNAVVGQIER